ncbi:hypothetical protein [Yersinia intermedia]
MKAKIVDLTMNNTDIRDTARGLHVSIVPPVITRCNCCISISQDVYLFITRSIPISSRIGAANTDTR